MTIRHIASTIVRHRPRIVGVAILTLGLVACSSDGLGLKFYDGGSDVKANPPAFDTGVSQGGAGGALVKADAGTEAGMVAVGSGGAGGTVDAGTGGVGGAGSGGAPGTVDASASTGGTGGTGGVAGALGSGGARTGGASGTGTAGMTSTGGAIVGSGGTGTAGAPGTGGATGGTGGTTQRDAGSSMDMATDVPLAPDVAADGPAIARDSGIVRADAVTIDGAVACGDLDEACCSQRTCNSPSTICTSSGAGGGGICVACGGDGDPCCAGDTCTAPGTVCSGGRGGGTCR